MPDFERLDGAGATADPRATGRQGPIDTRAEAKARTFFAEEATLLEDIAGRLGFHFRRGPKGGSWAIDPEKGTAYYDPSYFEEKGYTEGHALAASLHEIVCHLVETAELRATEEGEREYQALRKREKRKPWLSLLENCREDAKGNLAITAFAPSLREPMQSLYRDRLFPATDYRTMTIKGKRVDNGEEIAQEKPTPRFVQFIYAMLRERMLPGEPVTVSDDVREKLEQARHIPIRAGGRIREVDAIEAATRPGLDPLKALLVSRRYIEPIVEALYRQDLQDHQDLQEKIRNGEVEVIEIESDGQPFGAFYDDYDERHPEPWEDEDEAKDTAKEAMDIHGPGGRNDAAYEAEHGITMRQAAAYRAEYRVVESYMEGTREVIRRITTQRKIIKPRLVAGQEDGVMVDPGLIAQGYIDISAGVTDPRIFLDILGRPVSETAPGKVNFRVVADKSGSMDDNGGEKAIEQRRAAIGLMEPLAELSAELDTMRENGQLAVELAINTELRSFGNGDTLVEKPLSPTLTERERVAFFESLLETGGGTNDFDALDGIITDIEERIARDPQYAEDLRTGKQREVVIFLTDGGSNSPDYMRERIEHLRELGAKVIGVGITADGQAAEVLFAPDGQVCYTARHLPKVLQDLLVDILGDLSTTGNPDDLLIPEVK